MHIIAHRGFRGRYPEMSPLAYEKALELPIHGVECDIRLTADGHVVCVHDTSMRRVAGEPVRVALATLRQLKRLDIGEGQQVLTLDELLDMVFATEDKHIYIEPKHPVPYGRILEEQMVLRLRYRGLETSERIHVISFSHAAMRRTQALAPQLDTYYLRRDWERRVNPGDYFLSRPRGSGMSIEMAKLFPHLLRNRTERSYLYTVNEPEDMLFARDNGATVIATDYPDVALRTLGHA